MARLASRADGRDRAQTAHDFALGMGVFLLTVAFVFAALPSLVMPYEGDATGLRQERAQRVAATAIHDLSTDRASNRLDPVRTAAFFQNTATGESLREHFGLPDYVAVNLTVRNGTGVVDATAADGTVVPLAAGDAVAGRGPTTTVRVVTFENESACRPACRLEVAVR